MDSLNLLEKRIEALELQILPKNRNSESDEASASAKAQAITDLLLQTETMINSALSCREAITSILRHMTTINEYLDPCNGETELEVEAKRHYLLELYPELKDTVKMIGTFESLTPYTNSDNIMKVTKLSEKLAQLAAYNLNVYEECREVSNNVLEALERYNEITASIKLLFAQLDRAITDLEVALLPKFITEE